MTTIAVLRAGLTVFFWALGAFAGTAEPSPLFDLRDIAERPLEAKVLERREDADVIVERIEYLSQQVGDEAVRVDGIFARPAGSAGDAGLSPGRRGCRGSSGARTAWRRPATHSR